MPDRSTATRLAVAIGALLLLAGAARAQTEADAPGDDAGPPPRAEEMVDVRLLADVDHVMPGASFHLAVVFDIAPKWHIYWMEPGDSGAPTEVEVTAPDGFKVGPARFPRPELIMGPEGRSNGYHGQTVLFVPVTAPTALGGRTVSLDADVFYFVCKEICLIGRARQSIELPVAAGSTPESVPAARATGSRALLERYRSRLPAPIDTVPGAAARLEPPATATTRRLLITGPAAGFTSLQLFPIDAPGVTFGPAEVSVTDDRFRVVVDVELRPHNALGQPMRAQGVVGLGPKTSDPAFSFDIPLEIDP